MIEMDIEFNEPSTLIFTLGSSAKRVNLVERLPCNSIRKNLVSS